MFIYIFVSEIWCKDKLKDLSEQVFRLFITNFNNDNNLNSVMTGEILKSILFRNGIQLKDIAEKLDMSQQNFSNALKVADVKTGLLEKLCDVLNVTLDYFYYNTKYSSSSVVQVTASGQSIATNSGDISLGGQNENNGHIGVQNNCAGTDTHDKKDNVTTLTETVSTLTRELETSQQQKSHLISVVATSQKQIQQMTDIIDRLTK